MMGRIISGLELAMGFILILVSFQFGKGQISQFPHISSFEDELICISGCNTNCPLQGTWRNETNEDLDWVTDRSGTPSAPTGPPQDHTFGNAQGFYIYIESSCNNQGFPNKRSDLVSAYFDFSAVTDTVFLSFWYHMYGVHMGDLHLDADTSGGNSPWVEDIIPSLTDNVNLWQRQLIDLGPYMGMDSVRFRFRCITGTNYAGDMALDDIDFFIPQENDLEVVNIIEPVQGCALSDTESVSVTLFNHGTNDLLPGDTVRLCYQTDLTNPVSETFTLADTLFSSGQLDLTFAQQTDLSLIGPHNISAWSKMTPLGTSHNRKKTVGVYHFEVVNQFPYAEGFENGPGPWRVEGVNSSWGVGTPTKTVINGAANGANAWVTGTGTTLYNNGENAYVIGPCFDLTNVCRPELRLNVAWESEHTWDGSVIQYSTNGGASWVRLGAFNDPFNWYNSNDIYVRPGGQPHGWTGTVADGNGSGGWLAAKRNMYNLSGRPDVLVRVVFQSDNGVNGEGFAFDDFVISNGVYLGPDISICTGDSAVLDADFVSGDSYLWSTGATSQTIAVSTPGVYWVEVSNNSFCTTSDTIEVFGISAQYQVALGADTSACGEYILDAPSFPGFTYLWSNGESGQNITVTNSGDYYVDVTTPCGIVRSDTQNIQILPFPALDLGPDTTVCAGVTLIADPGAASYFWSTGAATQSLPVNTSGTYSVTATSSDACSSIDSIAIFVAGFPAADLGPDTIMCPGDSLCFLANPDPGFGYAWTTGAQTNEICVGAGGVYAVTVTNQENCPFSDTVIVTIPDNPIANIAADTSNCPTINFFGNTTGGPVDDWIWVFGDGDSAFVQNPTHAYPNTGLFSVELIATNACGADTTVFSLPLICEVGINDELGLQVELFPNPADDLLNLRFSNSSIARLEVHLYDLMGKEVLEPRTFTIQGNGEASLNLEGLTSGVYLIELRAGNKLARKRIIVR